jgi:hypothetical protein
MVVKNVSYPSKHGSAQEQPALPEAMHNRPDAREIRTFMESYEAIEDPALREQIRNAVFEAAAESK